MASETQGALESMSEEVRERRGIIHHLGRFLSFMFEAFRVERPFTATGLPVRCCLEPASLHGSSVRARHS